MLPATAKLVIATDDDGRHAFLNHLPYRPTGGGLVIAGPGAGSDIFGPPAAR
jgi:hypothetical protein